MSAKSIPFETLKNWIGKKVHLSNYRRGCVWKLISLYEDNGKWMMNLETPKTHKKFTALASMATYLNKDVPTYN